MKTAIICFSDAGAALAQRLSKALDADIHSTEKYAHLYGFTAHKSITADMGYLFENRSALVFIGSCGIAVRCIAPHIRNKTTDPAVIVLDDAGRFVIPVLSGHIGGANELARSIAELIAATPVITTATDVHGRFSCDEWAVRNGCAISSLITAKEVSAAILKSDIPISSEFQLPEAMPGGLIKEDSGSLGIYIGINRAKPYSTTLALIPRIITVGIGCRRGASCECITGYISEVLRASGIDSRAVKAIATIDIKKDEPGLIEAAAKLGVPLVFYTAEELNAVEGDFAESEFVKKTTGTGNVCERAAAAAGGRIIVKKAAWNGVTAALSEDNWEIRF